jgi:hypothetical protein
MIFLGGPIDNSWQPRAIIRANHPMVPVLREDVYYFEVKVKEEAFDK